MQPGEKFFRGVIREPDGSGEKVVVGKATKALAKRIATTEAGKLNWDSCQTIGRHGQWLSCL